VIEFNVKKYGDPSNPPAVFLHGFMGSADDWQDVINSITDNYYCLAFDLPGHGLTKVKSIDEYKIQTCAQQLVEWLELNIKNKFDLCGYSMGGRLALYMAVNYSDRIKKVIIESASPGLKTKEERQNRIQIDNLRAKRILMESLDQFLDDWYELPLFDNINKESDDYKSMIERRLKNNPILLAKSLLHMGTGNQPSLWDQFDKIKSQLLLIVGEKDDKFKMIAGEIADNCYNAKMKIIPDSGHTVHLENKDTYIKEIIDFLKE
jgi:2-succinyl-6-hydroxy-2,4-cyclohexadiene-1-carboxylate synthase